MKILNTLFSVTIALITFSSIAAEAVNPVAELKWQAGQILNQ